MATSNSTNEGTEKRGEEDMVSLQSLSQLTGFPTELIKKELLINDDENSKDDGVSLAELRELMADLINKTFQDDPSEVQQ